VNSLLASLVGYSYNLSAGVCYKKKKDKEQATAVG